MDKPGRLYFDNAATSYPKPPAVYEAMDRYARLVGGSAGRSAHRQAVAGSRLLFDLRSELADLAGGDPDLVVLTKNATEAINLLLLSLLKEGTTVAHGALEHNAVMRPLSHLAASRAVRLVEVPGDEHGRMTAANLQKIVRQEKVDLVVTLHASNVHGLAQDLTAIGEVCRGSAIPLVVDAAQSAGVMPIDMRAMNIAALCLTGHKSLLGPTGVGALLLTPDVADRIQPVFHGGTGSVSEQETMPDFLPDRLEAGTHNTIGAAGLLAGLRYVAGRTVADNERHERVLRNKIIDGLKGIGGLRVLGDDQAPATSTVSFTAPLAPSDIAYLLDQRYGISVRPGLHCAPRAHRTLGTMPAGALRLAPGPLTESAAVDEVLAAIGEIMGELA